MLNRRTIFKIILSLSIILISKHLPANDQIIFLTLDGEQKKPEGPFVINFWATWCAPCLKELPDLEILAKELRPEIPVFLVNIGETNEVVTKFYNEKSSLFGPYALVLLDTKMESMSKFKLRGLPTTVLFDSNGNEIRKIQGIRPCASEKMITLMKKEINGI